MRRRLLCINLAIAVVVAGAYLLWSRGVKTVVRNTGSATIREVQVLVTGHSYALGDIRPNEVRSVHVKPSGESSIVIRFTDADGTSKSVDVNCYLESGSRGNISVDVAHGAIVRKAENTWYLPL
ncbi:hypothetical protein BH09PLA1_BH09PLA1_11050 [soil metagenome]